MEKVKLSKFKSYLDENDITYADVANLLGVTRSTVSEKMNGNAEFKLDELRKIAIQYQISVQDYFIYPKVSK